MTAPEAAAVLTIAGSSSQLIGVLLVIWDLLDARRMSREAPIRPERSMTVETSFMGATGPPTLENRVAVLERGQQYILVTKLGEVHRATGQVHDLGLARDDDVRELIAKMAGSHLWRRSLAAVLLILGTGALLAGGILTAVDVF